MLRAEQAQRLVDPIYALIHELDLLPGRATVARLHGERAAVVRHVQRVGRVIGEQCVKRRLCRRDGGGRARTRFLELLRCLQELGVDVGAGRARLFSQHWLHGGCEGKQS